MRQAEDYTYLTTLKALHKLGDDLISNELHSKYVYKVLVEHELKEYEALLDEILNTFATTAGSTVNNPVINTFNGEFEYRYIQNGNSSTYVIFVIKQVLVKDRHEVRIR